MTIKASTRRRLAALVLAAGVTGAATAQNAQAFGYMGVAIIVEPAQSGGVKQGGAGKYYRRSFQQQPPTRKAPGTLAPPRRKCPGAHVPDQLCRKV